MAKRKNESGFTLLEVAMVLIVASLIVLSVIKSQGIWNEAKSFRLQRQVQELQVAVALYESKIGVLPGDTTFNGQIDNTGPNSWSQMLYEEGFVVSIEKSEKHPFGGSVSLEWNEGGSDGPWSTGDDANIFSYASVPDDFARALDEALDDGLGNEQAGSILATNPGASNSTAINYGGTSSVNLWIKLN
jgi:type II secretory pathway pseudopilin PulG